MIWGGGGAGPGHGVGVPGQHSGNPGGGLPFAGIPADLMPGVERILAVEPKRPEPQTSFSYRTPSQRRLSLYLLLSQHPAALAIASLMAVIETSSLQAGPLLTQIGIDRGISARNAGVVIFAALAYVFAVMSTAVSSAARVQWTGRLAAYVMNDTRVRVFAHLQRMSLDYFTEEKAGVILTRMTSDIEALQQFLQDGLGQFAIQGLSLLVVAAVMLHYNVRLALITLGLVVPIVGALSLWFRSASAAGYQRVRDGIAGVLSDLAESLHGVRVVVAHNRQRHNVIHHRNVVDRYRDANNYTAQITAIYGPGTDMIGVLGQAVLLLIGGEMVLQGQLTVGELTAFILYLGALFQPIQQLVQVYNTYQQAQAAIIKLRILLGTEPSVVEAADAVEMPRLQGEIAFDHVSFAYEPGAGVLTDVDFRVRPGETVAFVGPTGGGKSTLAKLIVRFYDPTSGRVLIDGQDIRAVTLASLRRQLGVVPQEPFLFAGTIRDNIAFARPSARDDEVLEAVDAVGLDDLINRLPDGIHTLVHERGQSLSSGERQLIALARAFIVQPRVLVLDEATSNLDLESETRVEKALDVVLQGRTAILIAHRLSTAMRADRIVVIDQGRVIEMGSHSDLVAGDGLYASMYTTWIKHGGDDGSPEAGVAAKSPWLSMDFVGREQRPDSPRPPSRSASGLDADDLPFPDSSDEVI